MLILSTIKYSLAIPHLIFFSIFLNKNRICKEAVLEDLAEMNKRCHIKKGLTYYLVNRAPYRNVFYYRIGTKWARLLKLFLPEYKGFYITPHVKKIGGGVFVLNHPYGTILNAKEIGTCFTVCQLTTLGNKEHGKNDQTPVIGDNVSLGANVNIIGNIKVGNNVIVGAGSVVVKDIPDNCIVAGNPAKIIRHF